MTSLKPGYFSTQFPFMRFLKILLKFLGGFVLLIVLLLAFMVTTVDDTPYKEMAYYKQWKESVGSVQRVALKLAAGGVPLDSSPQKKDTNPQSLNVGWAKVNFTPKSPTPKPSPTPSCPPASNKPSTPKPSPTYSAT